jgi:hypothetical protein
VYARQRVLAATGRAKLAREVLARAEKILRNE